MGDSASTASLSGLHECLSRPPSDNNNHKPMSYGKTSSQPEQSFELESLKLSKDAFPTLPDTLISISHVQPTGRPDLEQDTTLTSLLSQVRLEPSTVPRRDANDWQGRTILDDEFANDTDKIELLRIAKFFSQSRPESDLVAFLEAIRARFPPISEWIWPLLEQFRQYRGKPVIVVLLQCPRRDETITKPPHASCFTHEMIDAIENSLRPLGLGVLKLDFRKQCRRTKDNKHCPSIGYGRESFILGLCTVVEMLIATRIFSVRIHSTIAFSKSIASPGGGIDIILQWDKSLIGAVYRVPWHPRILYAHLNQGVAYRNALLLLQSHLFPILQSISLYFQRAHAWYASGVAFDVSEHSQLFLDYCRRSDCGAVRFIFAKRSPQSTDCRPFRQALTSPSDSELLSQFRTITQPRLPIIRPPRIVPTTLRWTSSGGLSVALSSSSASVTVTTSPPLESLSLPSIGYTESWCPDTNIPRIPPNSAEGSPRFHSSIPNVLDRNCLMVNILPNRYQQQAVPQNNELSDNYETVIPEFTAPFDVIELRRQVLRVPQEFRSQRLDSHSFPRLPIFLDTFLDLTWDTIGAWIEDMFPGTGSRFLELKWALSQSNTAVTHIDGDIPAQNVMGDSTEQDKQSFREELRLRQALEAPYDKKLRKKYNAQAQMEWYRKFLSKMTPNELKAYRERKHKIGIKVRAKWSAAQWDNRRKTNRESRARMKSRMTEQQLEEQRAKASAYNRTYRARVKVNQTPAEREKFLEKDRIRMKQKRSNMTPAQRRAYNDRQNQLTRMRGKKMKPVH
ncbi:Uncharacterized protein LW94_2312 [Fusarium fujikuroi]|nr:Uncharacterized protein LW94_2312 [Fusarium fujikuroi]SCO48644.1 uncharacterized protein FFMR_09283 [Fusarium fujikuroi]SCV35065.1 uncharacterized protein FFFS_04573 [Fusarium fujikuroi]